MLPSTNEQALWWDAGRNFEREQQKHKIEELEERVRKHESNEEALRGVVQDLREALREVSIRDANTREQLAKLWHHRPGALRRWLLERVIG